MLGSTRRGVDANSRQRSRAIVADRHIRVGHVIAFVEQQLVWPLGCCGGFGQWIRLNSYAAVIGCW